MLAPPKALIRLGAGWHLGRAARRLRTPGIATAEQAQALRALLPTMAPTAFGRDHGLSGALSYDQFRQRVPVRSLAQFRPYLERIYRHEPDVLWPGRCDHFALTAGTTTGVAQRIPWTSTTWTHFRQAAWQALLHYMVRVGHADVLRGRHVYLAPPPLAAADPTQSDPASLLVRHLPPWVQTHLHAPAADQPTPAANAAPAPGARREPVSLVAGLPHALLEWLQAPPDASGAARTPPTNPGASWPNLECVLHGGTLATPYLEELRQVAGAKVRCHEVYAAAEAVIAAQDPSGTADLRLLTGAGVFFEFLPWAQYGEGRGDPSQLAVPLEGVTAGQDYVLLLTTPSGLARYVLGDVVRVVAVDPPRLRFVGRTHLRLNSALEQVSEREVSESLAAVCQRHGWHPVNFHVAPFMEQGSSTSVKPRHEWWIELKPGTMETPTGPNLAPELDAELQRISEPYRQRRRTASLAAPYVRLVMPGLFEQWLRGKGRWGRLQRVPRCRSDRAMADELAQLAPFSAH